MPLSSNELFKRYPNKYFVETGTFQGAGLDYAYTSGAFQHLRSVEIVKDNYEKCSIKFKEQIEKNEIKLYLGESEFQLWEMIKDIDEPITFWLDAHYSGKTKTYTTGKSDVNSPIIRELNVIKRHPIKNHTILIDDRRDFGTPNFDNAKESEAIKVFKEINPNYIIQYDTGSTVRPLFENDVLVAKV